MKHSIDFKPYTTYWMNCVLSLEVSLVSSLEPTYSDAALMNHYRYINFGNSIWWKLLEIQYDPAFYHTMEQYITLKPIEPFEPDSIKQTLRQYIDQNRLVLLVTDCYYSMRDSLHYHRTHKAHEWLMSSYDDRTGSFFCFSDYTGGFGENEMLAEDFELSLLPETYTGAFEIIMSSEIPSFSLRLEDVRRNAQEINKSIAALSYCNFWKCNQPEYTEDRFYDISKFIGRQTANRLLFELMGSRSMIPAELSAHLAEACQRLEKGWTSLRGKMVKSFLRSKVPDYGKISVAAWELLNQEHTMWSDFLKGTAAHPHNDIQEEKTDEEA